jgi:hypothetical protein
MDYLWELPQPPESTAGPARAGNAIENAFAPSGLPVGPPIGIGASLRFKYIFNPTHKKNLAKNIFRADQLFVGTMPNGASRKTIEARRYGLFLGEILATRNINGRPRE